MSLEAAIAELNANIKTLINVMSAQSNAGRVEPVKETATPKPEAIAVKVTTETTTTGTIGGAPLDYVKDVQPLVLKVSSVKGRDAAIALLAKFGLASAKDSKPEQYADIIAACKEVLQ